VGGIYSDHCGMKVQSTQETWAYRRNPKTELLLENKFIV